MFPLCEVEGCEIVLEDQLGLDQGQAEQEENH